MIGITTGTLSLLVLGLVLQGGAVLVALLTMRALGRLHQGVAHSLDPAARRQVRGQVRRGREPTGADRRFAESVAQTLQVERGFALALGLLGLSLVSSAAAWSFLPVAAVVLGVGAAGAVALAGYLLVVARRARGLLPASG